MREKMGKRSVILCEGPDDLWFISRYLRNAGGWDGKDAKEVWTDYKIPASSDAQEVDYLKRGNDTAAVWCVGSKTAFRASIEDLNKLNRDHAPNPIDSIVIVRDRDEEDDETILQELEGYFEGQDGYSPQCSELFALKNRTATKYQVQSRDGREVITFITPVIIPVPENEKGALETLLMDTVREEGEGGKAIVHAAEDFVSSLASCGSVLKVAKHLKQKRMILKAKFSSVVAIKNPKHSPVPFRNMFQSIPWDKSDTVKNHFSIILSSITSE